MQWKKIILKGNITAYIEHKHKNTVALSQPPNIEKTVSLKSSFGFSEIWSRFSRLVCFKYITKFLPASFCNTIVQTRHTYAWKQYFMRSNNTEVHNLF